MTCSISKQVHPPTPKFSKHITECNQDKKGPLFLLQGLKTHATQLLLSYTSCTSWVPVQDRSTLSARRAKPCVRDICRSHRRGTRERASDRTLDCPTCTLPRCMSTRGLLPLCEARLPQDTELMEIGTRQTSRMFFVDQYQEITGQS